LSNISLIRLHTG